MRTIWLFLKTFMFSEAILWVLNFAGVLCSKTQAHFFLGSFILSLAIASVYTWIIVELADQMLDLKKPSRWEGGGRWPDN
jgi:hypothetical protein